MHSAAPTMTHVVLIYGIERRLSREADGAAVVDAVQLKTEFNELRIAVRKVEAKINGKIQLDDWQRLGPDLSYVQEALNRLRSYVYGPPWEGPLPAVQEVA